MARPRRTLADCRALLDAGEYRALREAEFQALVREEAEIQGWLVHCVYDSRRSPEGWPDLTLVRAWVPDHDNSPLALAGMFRARMIVAELKTERGKVTGKQRLWLEALKRVGNIEVYVWRPSDWRTVMEELQ